MSHYRRDHTPGATWFFTTNLADRQSDLLVRHIDQLREAWRHVPATHPFETLAVCILPDHIHTLWRLPEGDSNYALRWRLIKSRFTRGLPAASARTKSQLDRGESGLWQRRYWEHAIRNERDLQAHVDYIHFNPVKHGHVEQVKDWPHSSFHRFVTAGHLPIDWGGGQSDVVGRFGE